VERSDSNSAAEGAAASNSSLIRSSNNSTESESRLEMSDVTAGSKLSLAYDSLREALGALAAWLLSPDRGIAGARRVETKPLLSLDGRTLSLETVLVRGSVVDFVHKVEFEHK